MDNLSYELLTLIFNNLNKIKDKKNFSIINKDFYGNYGGDNIKKLQIEFFLNNDYMKFYEYLNKYTYDDDFLERIGKIAINNIPAIYGSRSCGYYDMRFIFELMYFGIILDDNLVKKLNKNFYIFFYKNLKACMISKNKKKTIDKVNKQKMLQSLKNNFKVYQKDIYNKSYIKLLYDIEFYY